MDAVEEMARRERREQLEELLQRVCREIAPIAGVDADGSISAKATSATKPPGLLTEEAGDLDSWCWTPAPGREGPAATDLVNDAGQGGGAPAHPDHDCSRGWTLDKVDARLESGAAAGQLGPPSRPDDNPLDLAGQLASGLNGLGRK